MSRMPSDHEIREAGLALGHGPGPYPTKIRAQLARTVQEANRMEATARVAEESSDLFVERISSLYEALQHRLSAGPAESITAAVAPAVYRSTQENTAR